MAKKIFPATDYTNYHRLKNPSNPLKLWQKKLVEIREIRGKLNTHNSRLKKRIRENL